MNIADQHLEQNVYPSESVVIDSQRTAFSLCKLPLSQRDRIITTTYSLRLFNGELQKSHGTSF